MYQDDQPLKRQLWGGLGSTSTEAAFTHHCTPFTLPSRGVVVVESTTFTLTRDALFRPECTGKSTTDISTISGIYDPFYASAIPQVYVIAAATVIAWILVIMLIITPRTNFLGQSGTAPGFNTGHGIIGGSTGGNTDLIGIGSRPWLQKVAAFTVAISLTIATADTFKFAQEQYATGYMDATMLRDQVLGSLEIRIMRVITDVFLWLAQVQTLIRLFPRHKEKVLIKWIGFALILFDSVFSCLNSFLIHYKDQRTPQQFRDAVPALSYLFEFAVGLLYAAWVIYYSLTKRRYAFYHPKMTSISLIAILSLIAVLTPVVFFVTDVSNSDIAGWGDYFRWVGAAAASVIVWEWVERIEALERDEKKDGILGREIFDGDEMLDVTRSDEIVWAHARHDRNRYRRNGGAGDGYEDDGSGSGGGGGGTHSSALEKGLISSMAQRFPARSKRAQQRARLGRADTQASSATTDPAESSRRSAGITFDTLPRPREQDGGLGPEDPPRIISPVSRADTTSAASTVYVVQQDTAAADVPQPVRRGVDPNGNTEQERAQARAQQQNRVQRVAERVRDPEKEEAVVSEAEEKTNKNRGNGAWLPVSNPFKRKRASPPAEVQQARQGLARDAGRAATPAHNFSRWDVKNRIGVLAAETGDVIRDVWGGRRQSEDVQVTIIPAQPRGTGKAWMPPEPRHGRKVPATAILENGESSSNLWRGPAAPTTNANSTDLTPQSSGSRTADNVASAIGATAPSPSERSRNSPPRADDIRPTAGSTSPVIIPAPRRSTRSSPLAERYGSPFGSAPQDAARDGNG